ncbi:multifunctional methyltransferase subunit TRM112-like protein [Liolophura sinensis]|uniref:multifunctional methyltransferase subunit TRM112-like protein n=1 Tax=Liolophura sinensis TaxID=3198878 RepID=UPI0031593017
MKLLTHNMLTSNIIKGVTKGYPLNIVPTTVEVKEVDFNPEFIARMIPKVDWSALKQAADQIGKTDQCPAEVVPEYESNEEFLKKAHHLLLEVEIKDGDLVCPETGRKFPVSNGIPNMLLNEAEV